MPLPIPPRPPSDAEYETRRAAGCTTWRELDPDLAEWVDYADKMARFQIVVIVLGVAGLIAVLIMFGIARLYRG